MAAKNKQDPTPFPAIVAFGDDGGKVSKPKGYESWRKIRHNVAPGVDAHIWIDLEAKGLADAIRERYADHVDMIVTRGWHAMLHDTGALAVTRKALESGDIVAALFDSTNFAARKMSEAEKAAIRQEVWALAEAGEITIPEARQRIEALK